MRMLVRVCAHVCVCLHAYVLLCMHACVHTCMCVYVYVCVSENVGLGLGCMLDGRHADGNLLQVTLQVQWEGGGQGKGGRGRGHHIEWSLGS